MTQPTVVLDIGNVLVGWDPRRVYARLIDDPDERDRFLREVCSPAWHDRQDRGRSTTDGVAELVARHPGQAGLITAFYDRWEEMFAPMPASVDLLRELHRNGVRLLALTNWPAEQFRSARHRWSFLGCFEGIVVSGEEGAAKPDQAMFRTLLDRYHLDPRRAVYVDDNPGHVATATGLGMAGIVFESVPELRRRLAGAGLPVAADVEVRPGRLDDLPALTAIYNSSVTSTAATFDVDPFPVEARRTWFEQYAATGAHRLLVAVRGGDVVGYATSSRFRPKRAYDRTVETTIYLAAGSAGRGIGSMLYQQLFTDLVAEPVHRAVASIAVPNDASVALHRRFGFQPAGTLSEVGRKFGQWWDVAMMQRPLP